MWQNCCEKTLITKEEDSEEIEAATASLASAKDISMDVAVAAVLSELDDIFAFNEEQRSALKAFLGFTAYFYSQQALAEV